MKKIIILLLALMVAFTFISCDEPEAPHEHKWDKGTITKEATCTEAGVMTYTCACGETKTEPIPAAHSIDEETGKCKHCGSTQAAIDAQLVKINDTYYESLAEAVDKAESGATITMLRGATGNGIGLYTSPSTSQTGTKDITIDFNGFTYTIDGELQGSPGTVSQAFHLEKDCTVVLKNGTITSTKARMLVQNYCNLTLENMILDYVESNKDYALSVNHGNVKIIDTQIKVAAGKVAFDSCKFSSYPIPTVTVSGTSQIDGAIELSGGTLVIPEAMKDNIKYAEAEGYNETKYTLTTKDGVITAIAK